MSPRRECDHPGYMMVGWPVEPQFECVRCHVLADRWVPIGKIENIPQSKPDRCEHIYMMFTGSQTVLCLSCGARFKPIESKEELDEWMLIVRGRLNDSDKDGTSIVEADK